ncbi:ATP-binding cassette domain-containing protein [Actinoalloteichus hymeniacidonis]|uniref:Daunorubicin resistance ABC transporter ATP-binding subunit n=1 Tax=Actinoalloteichus hymeniacidonis TaxID=340345 RepID=A0AAC9MYT0_9PSEU|nr:ATP-binding cassette domain-containing protein [Actinoalloteichus hymeniacidonis]AOS63211.1 daunorubicin resistance ABC transporter ATP-binding subunit [Actinoalloteichus hymeniacidonis]MBB5908752.1 ABC-2 type transport system ATP-binding protein [Actinoalloteichus hymeniacidonis]
MAAMISAIDLRKTYGKRQALDGFTLSVDEGTVCGLLGPNGAGKTTAVRILATLLKADSGSASIAGYDVATDAGRVRAAIGFTGQYAAVDEILTGRQNLDMFARLYHLDRRRSRERTDELIDRFGLHDTADRPAGGYSGGTRRRLDLAVSLILAPRVLFLDEPTTGLDPRTRAEVWKDIRQLVSAGTTVLLTTQYLDEADHLADQIAVIDDGAIIAGGTPRELKESVGGDQIELVLRDEEQMESVARILAASTGSEPTVNLDRRRISAPAPDRFRSLDTTMRNLDRAGIDPEDIALRRPTLDDVFLKLTDRKEKAA